MTASEPEDPAERSEPGGGRPAERPSDSPVARRAELPPDVDAAFAAIVADWAAADAPHWPARGDGSGPDAPSRPDARDDDGPSSGVGTATPPHGWVPGGDRTAPTGDVPGESAPPTGPRRPDGRVDGRGDGPVLPPHRPHAPTSGSAREEEFVPPEPPPLPRPRFGAVLGLVLLVVGVVLLAVPGLLGGPIGLGIVPGLLAMTAGLGWLVLGLRRRGEDDEGDGPDDGAVV